MKSFEVLNYAKAGDNTVVTIKNNGTEISIGSNLLDDNGKPHILLSIGMISVTPDYNIRERMNTMTLLIAGDFSSENIYI